MGLFSSYLWCSLLAYRNATNLSMFTSSNRFLVLFRVFFIQENIIWKHNYFTSSFPIWITFVVFYFFLLVNSSIYWIEVTRVGTLLNASIEMISRGWSEFWGWGCQPDTGVGLEAGCTGAGIECGSRGAGLGPGALGLTYHYSNREPCSMEQSWSLGYICCPDARIHWGGEPGDWVLTWLIPPWGKYLSLHFTPQGWVRMTWVMFLPSSMSLYLFLCWVSMEIQKYLPICNLSPGNLSTCENIFICGYCSNWCFCEVMRSGNSYSTTLLMFSWKYSFISSLLRVFFSTINRIWVS